MSDASDEIRLATAALASVVDRNDSLDQETADAVSVAANRLALSKQRQRKLDSLLTRTEFGDYIARLLVVVRAYVPGDKWKDCEADIARVPVLLDGGTDP